MKGLFRLAVLLFAVCLVPTAGAATIIGDHSLEYIKGLESWEYRFTIFNYTNEEIFAFSVQFEYGPYEKPLYYLHEASAPDGWETVLSQPGIVSGTKEYGELLVFNLDAGIQSGDSLGVFSVIFNWLGNGPPELPLFDLLNSDGTSIWDEPRSAPPLTPDPVPEPGTLVLLGTGILGLAAYYRRNLSRKSKR